ncbi:uncharacterized protein METZ01_LOCUS283503, partial [marine metagenome]
MCSFRPGPGGSGQKYPFADRLYVLT